MQSDFFILFRCRFKCITNNHTFIPYSLFTDINRAIRYTVYNIHTNIFNQWNRFNSSRSLNTAWKSVNQLNISVLSLMHSHVNEKRLDFYCLCHRFWPSLLQLHSTDCCLYDIRTSIVCFKNIDSTTCTQLIVRPGKCFQFRLKITRPLI